MNEDLLLVDDDTGAIRLMDRVLEGIGRHRFATSGLEALRMARNERPDLMLLDAEMPGLDGLGVLRQMRDDPELRDVPVIMVTSHDDLEAIGLGLGAEDFICKPIDHARLLARVSARLREKQKQDQLQRLALLDPLTELANLRHFGATLEREWGRAARCGAATALVLLAIDAPARLRPLSAGARVPMYIRATARILQDAVRRPADFVAHLGHGEFAVLLPDTYRTGAEHLVLRIQKELAHVEVELGEGLAPCVLAASAGIACFDEASRGWVTPAARLAADPPDASVYSADDLLLAAQTALRAAQTDGPGRTRLLDACELSTGALPQRVDVTRQSVVRWTDALPRP